MAGDGPARLADQAPTQRSNPTPSEGAMRIDELEAEVALLISQMTNQPHDRHELYLQLKQKMSELRAFGMPIPHDFVEFEQALERECARNRGCRGSPGGAGT